MSEAGMPVLENPDISDSSASEVATPYHKGQVAQRLLEEARRIMTTEPVESISARRLCREVGVTSANFYNHFPNLEYLLLEIAAQEFALQSKQNRRILRRNQGRDASLLQIAQNKVDFSIRHQQLHRIMYGYIADSKINPNYMKEGDLSMGVLVQIVYGDDRYDPDDVVKSHETCTKAYAFVAFSTGLASSISQGIFANPSGTVAERKRFVESLTNVFIQGLQPEGK